MKFNAEKPTAPGTFLYKEGNEAVSIKVYWYEDLQSGISKSLVARPIPPRWKNLPVFVWDVSDLTGVFYDLDPLQVDETQEDPEVILPEMVKIPAGKFLMGSPAGEPGLYQHEVEVKAFYIGKYEVTFEEYDLFCEDNGREKPDDNGWGRGKRPVINVNLYDAIEYSKWLSGQTRKEYRLPTEEEWEYACRAGTKTRYSFGDDEGQLGNYAWFSDNSGDQAHPVGEKLPNPYGLYDMHGNVWEWTYSVMGGPCVLRGGSWLNEPEWLRGAARIREDPHFWLNNWGFRLARTFP